MYFFHVYRFNTSFKKVQYIKLNPKAKTLNISKEKLIETYKMKRYAEASRVMGNAEIFFETL
jgi:hypothetical protein